jgi:peroxiredoxin
MKFLLLLGMIFGLNVHAVENGKPAPDFSLPSSEGKTIKLSDYKGKTVVLEWLNHGCPFVKKHYESGNMQKLQKESVSKGVVWLSIISSAPGKQGHSSAAEAEKDKKSHGASSSAILIDESGAVGKQYGAKTTPHMYVIDGSGALVYQGAIDDKPSTNKEDISSARNYVREALTAVASGKKVELAQTTAYGCSVKY